MSCNALNKWHRYVIASDLHGPYLDRKAFKVFLSAVDDLNPQTIILNGDVCDFSQISSHERKIHVVDREYEEPVSLDEELFIVKTEIFHPLRKAAKKAKIIMRLGNHDIRWSNISESNPDALRQLMRTHLRHKSLYLEDVLECSRYGIIMDHSPAMEIGEHFTVIHGVKCSKNVARQNLLRYGSGTSGHSHRVGVYTELLRGKLQGWYESGCLRTIHNIEYLPFGDRPDWCQAFLTLTVNEATGKFFCKTHPIIGHEAEVNGKIYKQ